MQLIKFDPLRDVKTIEDEIESMLREGWSWSPVIAPLFALDMYEEDNTLVTEVALPQFKKKDIKVTVDSGGIEIAATHSSDEKSKKESARHYYRQESRQDYWRRINLPPEAEWAAASGEFKDGILSVKIPLNPSETTKSVDIK